MTRRGHYSDYTHQGTVRCERALVTLLGDLGPWRERIYLAGGLAPRYIVGDLPTGARGHAGTTDVDLIIGLAVGDDAPGAFNVRGAHLARDDFKEVLIEAERLDDGGKSKVSVRVANVLPYTALKIFAFQDRHENKDSYDLSFTLLNFSGGPEVAGTAAASSPVRDHPQVREALALLEERFRNAEQDGPHAYAGFLATAEEEHARLRQEAVAIVREFLAAFRRA